MGTVMTRADIGTHAARALSEWERANGPIGIGEQIHVDHHECGDTRSRFYIKRETDRILGYCHNCGIGGAHTAVKYRATKKTAAVRADFTPPDLTYTIPPAGLDWLHEWGFTEKDAKRWTIGWSPSSQRVCLPVVLQERDKITLTGYQLRRMGTYGPKYLSARGDAPMEALFRSHDPVVIVEDLLSAYRVYDAGFTSLPLLGYHIRPERIAALLSEGFTKFVVWLDNDKPEIIEASRHNKRLVLALGGECHTIDRGKEPKHFSPEGAARAIQNVLRGTL